MLEALIPAIGQDNFGKVAFDLFRQKMAVHHLTICRYLDGRPAKLFAVESAIDPRGFEAAIDLYMDTAYLNDPCREGVHYSPSRELVTLSVDADHVADRRTREQLYYARGIAAKDSLVIRRAHDVLTLTINRSAMAAGHEASWMGRWRGALAAAVERHIAILEQAAPDAAATLADLLREIPASAPLSKQEIAVCGLVVAGHSTESIAINLAVSSHSIVTYRRRAYAKLGVSSQNELFMLLLRQCNGCLRREAR